LLKSSACPILKRRPIRKSQLNNRAHNFAGVRTSARRVRRVMRENGLLAPTR
jgi:hypothetical protein